MLLLPLLLLAFFVCLTEVKPDFPDPTLGSLIREKSFVVPLTLSQVRHCYEPQVKNQLGINIFDPQRRWSSVVKFYYDAFPENEINAESIENLLNSTREMIRHCLTFDVDRPNHDGDNQVKYGFTPLSDKKDGYYHSDWLTAPSVMFPRQLAGQNYGCSSRGRIPLPDSFDWRRLGKVTPVKNQAKCNSCWAFAAVGALESHYLVHGKTSDPNFDLSEQQLIGCASDGYGCRPRPVQAAYEYILDYGLASERQVPYEARNSTCRPTRTRAARIRGYCSRGIYTEELLDDPDLQRALYDFGPLTVLLSSRAMRNYRGGIINDSRCNSGSIDHSAVLVGWTPNAWILKNSWGKWWGEKGYFRLARYRNMCSVNSQITFPLI